MTMNATYHKLINLLPLDTPLSLLIDPCNVCNFQCKFCPTGDKELLKSVCRPKGMMEYELFCKIIDDVAEFNKKVKKINIYKDGEPFLNKDTCKMINYAKKKGVAESIETTSNGSLIDETTAINIIDSGLDAIRISVEHINDQGYQDITKTFSDYDTIRKNISFLFNEKQKRNSSLKIHVKIIDVNLSEAQKEIFLNHFSPISDSINIDTLMGWSSTEKKDFLLGKDVDTGMDSKSEIKKDRSICPEPFKTLSINVNGDVSICCVDWAMTTVIGNVKNESLLDIWNGERIKTFRRTHLDGNRVKLKACSNCQYVQGANVLSDLDNYAGELKEIYN